LKAYQDKEMKKFKIFEEERPDEALEKMRELTKKPDNYEIYNKSLLKKMSNRNFGRNQSEDALVAFEKVIATENNHKKSMLANVSSTLGENADDMMGYILEEKTIFSQQIQVEPPDLPNAHSSSPIAPGKNFEIKHQRSRLGALDTIPDEQF
jgi:hypothetical protein